MDIFSAKMEEKRKKTEEKQQQEEEKLQQEEEKVTKQKVCVVMDSWPSQKILR